MSKIIQSALRVFDIEIKGIQEVRELIDSNFELAIDAIMKSSGKVIVTGMGKSGLIGQKFAATLSSTGTPAVFLHPSDAAHGDLGMISEDDVLITIGKSGESDELVHILPVVRLLKVTIISLVGNVHSSIAQLSDIVVNISVSEEACDMKLAPTTSTSAALVMCDAIAMVLRELKNFTSRDFALFHPAGQLGKRLTLKVSDVMVQHEALPHIYETDNVENLIYLISKYSLGVIGVVDNEMKLLGIITDGDLRRGLQKYHAKFVEQPLNNIMTKNPITIRKDDSAYDALLIMEKKRTINNLPVTENDKLIGMVSLHDLIKKGL